MNLESCLHRVFLSGKHHGRRWHFYWVILPVRLCLPETLNKDSTSQPARLYHQRGGNQDLSKDTVAQLWNTSGSEVSTKASDASSGPFCTDMVIDSRGVSRSRACCNCRALLPGTPEAPDTHERFVNLMCLCAQSCLTPGDPLDCSPPGSSVHGILQARILEWVAISSSMGSSRPGDRTCVSCVAGGFFTCWAIREALT